MSNNKPDVSEFGSVDPAPPSENSGVLELRNIGGKESVESLAMAF